VRHAGSFAIYRQFLLWPPTPMVVDGSKMDVSERKWSNVLDKPEGR
jgi:hypothetical protein